MFTVRSNFIGIFKVGDNINHNLKILDLLYSNYNKENIENKNLLCKPITVFLVSIIEAILFDFDNRIRVFTSEGVANLAQNVITAIQGKQIDKFELYIACARKHNLFDSPNTSFYDRLDEMRKLRNRIHIQNEKAHFEPDEINAFSEHRKAQAEYVLEKVAKVMSQKYPRGPAQSGYVSDFVFPWNQYIS